ncbi:hypothetical protein DLAC_07930 [Tieghemostelium lacteum]|uniref:Adiponectin receptor protein n=1 Tax=Tieghemostelium lacteum TaxID=361077 RepID=A0A151ZAQ7_TIELA|nr:hypothetical protein DLAC_07930 [Tieghemostelium lacteum]|eukprot:KYQ91030.1 hypothetical protein DLAC_07930 [Tieghemostelium lacteum]
MKNLIDSKNELIESLIDSEHIHLNNSQDSGTDSEIDNYSQSASSSLSSRHSSPSTSPITVIPKKFSKKKKSHYEEEEDTETILLTKIHHQHHGSTDHDSDTELLIFEKSKLLESSTSSLLTKRKSEEDTTLQDGNTTTNNAMSSGNSVLNSSHKSSSSLLSEDTTGLLDRNELESHLVGDNNDTSQIDNPLNEEYAGIDNKIKNTFVLTDYQNLPSYLQGNEYITSGYRVNFPFKLCLMSLFKMHNETLNIWTHLIGTIGFFFLMIYTQLTILVDAEPMDKFIFTIFFFGAISQMLFSTMFHLFCSVSPTTYLWFARLDYTGISLMIVGSYFPVLYYIFKCLQPLATLYITGISFLGVVGVIVGMLPIFQTHRFRTFRAVFFIIFGFYIIIPLPHLWVLKGFSYFAPVLWRLMLMGSIYISGATIYSTRCPECCCPGKLDYGWSSHPIWHIFCIVAALTQYYVCIYSYNNYGQTC